MNDTKKVLMDGRPGRLMSDRVKGEIGERLFVYSEPAYWDDSSSIKAEVDMDALRRLLDAISDIAITDSRIRCVVGKDTLLKILESDDD